MLTSNLQQSPQMTSRDLSGRSADASAKCIQSISVVNEEPAKLNRDVALRDRIQMQSSQYVIGFSYEKSAGHRYMSRQCFLFGKIL
jgi:hypothetical protein